MRLLHRLLLPAIVALPMIAVVACSDSGTPGTGGGSSGGSHAGGSGSTGTTPSTTGASMSTTGTGPTCSGDDACPPGSICTGGTCVAGCNTAHACDGTKSCCNGECADLTTDLAHCGTCDVACPNPPNIDVQCNGMCQIGACDMGFYDCDGNTSNGCESTTPCACNPGDVQACYSGPPGTENVGICKGGSRTCNISGDGYGPCLGQILPEAETCSDGLDHDCNGAANDIPDKDGDGWTVCNGDCCDEPGSCGGTPATINPGAFEVPNNGIDDDCDGTIDNPLAACDGGLASNSSSPLDYAKAIDLCATTTETPPIGQKKWGVISGNFFLANGSGTPAAASRSIRTTFGANVPPQHGSSFAILSTGAAAAQTAPSNANPAWINPQNPGGDMGTSSAVPADWLAANGNNFPNAPGCPAPQGGNTAHDPIMLKLRVRVPTNAQSFTVKSFFYSSEYPEWVCSAFNDFFLTLLDSSFVPGMGQSANPADKNLAFYDPPPAGPPFYPVGVNLAFGNTGLFTQCKNGPTGCGGGAVAGNTNTCASTTMLTGTGFDLANPAPKFTGDPGYCGTSNLLGGGTGWLTTGGNVVPGETIELRFVIWDTGDQWYDSDVLLDDFQWGLAPTIPGTHN